MIKRISLTVDEVEEYPDFDGLMQRIAGGALEVEIVESDTGRRRALLVASTTIAMLESVITKLS